MAITSMTVNSADLNKMFAEKKLQWDSSNAMLFSNDLGWSSVSNDFWDYASANSDDESDISVADGLNINLSFSF